MGGAGAINSMNAIIKQNRKLLRSVKARKAAFKNRTIGISNNQVEFEFPSTKPWVNREIKDKLQRDYKSAAIRLWGVMAVFIILFVYFMLMVVA